MSLPCLEVRKELLKEMVGSILDFHLRKKGVLFCVDFDSCDVCSVLFEVFFEGDVGKFENFVNNYEG